MWSEALASPLVKSSAWHSAPPEAGMARVVQQATTRDPPVVSGRLSGTEVARRCQPVW
jgi:hypothetical protein